MQCRGVGSPVAVTLTIIPVLNANIQSLCPDLAALQFLEAKLLRSTSFSIAFCANVYLHHNLILSKYLDAVHLQMLYAYLEAQLSACTLSHISTIKLTVPSTLS